MSKRLLLADDSITIQKVIGITFANEDFQLDIVDNGDAALQRVQAERPDMVLADVYMPGKNGYELCQAIKQDPQLQGIPVLLLTGTFEPFDEDKARQAGADDWISKPFESQALIDKVDELLATAASAPAPAAAAPVAPAAPVEEVVAAAVEPVEPVADVSLDEPEVELADDDLWAADDAVAFEEDAFDLVEPEAPSPPATPEPAVEAAGSGDDDIWGAVSFDEDELLATSVEDVAVDTAPEPVVPAAAEETAAADVWQDTEEEIFDLDDVDIIEEEDLLIDEAAVGDEPVSGFDQAFQAPSASPEPVAESVEPVAERVEPVAEVSEAAEVEEFTGASETPEVGPAGPGVEPTPLEVSEAEAFETEPLVEGFVPAAEAEPEPVVSAAPVPEDVIEQQVTALSEAQLEAIVEKVAGAVVERLAGTVLEQVAWEVVPDLAENLIKEEIRKIKEAV